MRIQTPHGYAINYGGGRLATIEVLGRPVEGVPVRAETNHGSFAEPEPNEMVVRMRVEDWLDLEDMPSYREQAEAMIRAERQHERECTDPRCMCDKRR